MNAGELEIGDDVRNADGFTGDVESMVVVPDQQWMYNLTVDVAHTFFVGQQGWLVHNSGPCTFRGKSGNDVFDLLTDGQTLTKNDALDAGIAFLGDGYVEIASSVFVSSDRTRML